MTGTEELSPFIFDAGLVRNILILSIHFTFNLKFLKTT
jgi:hypothetical protein